MSVQAQPTVVLAQDFTPQRVFVQLAAKFDAAGATTAVVGHIDRYSTGDQGGITSQVGRSTRQLGNDPDVQLYLALPEEAFDRARTDVGEPYGVIHLSLADIHPSVMVDEYVGAIVKCGATLFLRLSTSSTRRQIKRYDAADSNAYTVLVVALLNHTAANLEQLRWSDDTRRAGRETPSWQEIVSRAAELGKMLTFGQKTYNPQTDHLLLALLGGMNHQDDVTRIQSLTGGRIEKLLTSTCPISEGQLPHGIRHQRHSDGRVVIGEKKTKYAEVDTEWHPAIVEALRLHASGAKYVQIGLQVLVKHCVPRRGQNTPPGATYADLADLPSLLSDATKTFFVNGHRTAEDEEHLYLAKLEVWETGRYPYRLANNLKQRGVPVGGVVPSYSGADDVTGYFDVELDWGTALTGFKDDEERTKIIAQCRERLRAERRAPRRSDGRTSTSGDVRALGGPYERWGAVDEADQLWEGDTTMYGVTTRTNESGRNTFILVHYPLSSGTDANGRPYGLMRYANKPEDHVAATWGSGALCASVATEIRRLVENQILDPATVVPAASHVAPEPARDNGRRRSQLEAKREAALAKSQQLQEDAEGLEILAARKEKQGDQAAADRYDERARDVAAEAERERAAASTYAEQLENINSAPAPRSDQVEANISLAAYLQAGLNRASMNNGRSGPTLKRAAADHLSAWRFQVRDDQVEWSCTLALPLVTGDELRLPLCGSVENVRGRKGKTIARPDLIAEQLLRDGRSLDEVAKQQSAARKTILVKRMMPWLRSHGVTARGATNALVDHPFNLAKAVLYETLKPDTGQASSRHSPAFVACLTNTYLDPELRWGVAACPDDTTWIATALATVTQDANTRKHGVLVLDLALALGRTEDEIRELVKPQKRSGGFTRPRYLKYADKAKTRVQAIGCPHGRCHGRRFADHVILLPEVAASGFGVICTHCRRAPSALGVWADVQFPREYLECWTSRGMGGSLRTEAQTVPAAPAFALAL